MSQTTQAYCVKCRQTRDMLSPTAVYTATGTPGTRGQCPVCGTTLFRMGATPAHANLPRPEVTARKSTSKSAGGKSNTGRKKAGAKAKGRRRSPSKAASTRTTAAKAGAGKSAVRSNGRRKGGKLVIVESPAKARTVGHFLGRDYVVRASKGHVRDLLVSQLSVDVENNFEPKYRVPNEKRDTVKELKEDVQHADEIFLATDPDREGEAIAWHLMEAAEIDPTRVKRVVFHEITDEAVNDAFSHPRTINMDLVNAQQARRILDRLVGYPLTELLWDRVRNRLSAGRVQSIALRLVVDRERSIEAFVPVEYWTIDAQLKKQKTNGSRDIPFTARLIKIKGQDADFGKEEDVRPHLDVLERSQYSVADVKRGQRQRKPSPPFTTSTLQQEASRRLGFNARRTMTIAQQLYEGIDLPDEGTVGLITYMRTDSTHISTQAQAEARQYIEGRFGKSFMPPRAPEYKTKAKGAQEAHEAIRPTRVFRAPDSVKAILSRDQFRLYELIWQRFVASQMSNAVYDTLRVDISAGLTTADRPYLFRASGSVIKFAGFLALYEETRDEDLAADEDEGRILPDMTPGELLDLLRLLPQQHFTQPPPRYTEATLVRALEEFGIGRPSTYAPTVAVIQDRDYVQKQDKRLIPTDTGKIVNDLLVRYFPEVMDFQFTAQMEDQLDTISEGDLEWRDMLRSFYTSFEQQLGHARSDMPRVQQEEFVGRDCPVCGNPLVVRYGRWGKFIGCSTYPNCTHTEPYLELTGVTCPLCGQEHAGELVVRRTRRGRTFFGCSRYPECEYSTWKLPGKAGANRPEAEQDEDEAMVGN
jgi:DNA topoisomerase-1